MLYIVTNSENVEQIRKLVDKFPEDEVKVVDSVDKVPEGARNLDYIDPVPYYNLPEYDVFEELVASEGSEYNKLCSLDNKTKNQARRKLEHQRLKYLNKHYKK